MHQSGGESGAHACVIARQEVEDRHDRGGARVRYTTDIDFVAQLARDYPPPGEGAKYVTRYADYRLPANDHPVGKARALAEKRAQVAS